MIIGGLASYETTNPHGLEVFAFADNGADTSNVEIQLTPSDLAFLTCGMIDKYGLANVRRMVDDIATQDPTGRNVGLSTPAKILEGRKDR